MILTTIQELIDLLNQVEVDANVAVLADISINIYCAQNYQLLLADNTLFTADTTRCKADGSNAMTPINNDNPRNEIW